MVTIPKYYDKMSELLDSLIAPTITSIWRKSRNWPKGSWNLMKIPPPIPNPWIPVASDRSMIT